MRFPNKEQVERIRKAYPPGAKVECVSMEDPFTSIPPGTTGEVIEVDDAGTIFVNWTNNPTLGVVYGVDSVRLLTKAEVIKNQCRQVASTGRTNMFAAGTVYEIALEMGFNELAALIAADRKRYSAMVLTGELDDSDLVD
ncbi:MAG: DUF4314 domain-containing protein [Clostridia bacterium]|nr:DUF4314 domain-containing protein [Clostridia bacterium]